VTTCDVSIIKGDEMYATRYGETASALNRAVQPVMTEVNLNYI
jgi:hypothetical protein